MNDVQRSTEVSLAEAHASVPIPQMGPWWKRWFAIAGPALMVSVGYMDPGNWATDLAGGSRYGYRLIWVLLMSNIMAVLLQSLSLRLGLVTRRDLAQASRAAYPKLITIILYILAEIAITACDLAEVIGSAIALQLLFHLPLAWGVLLTGLDVLILLLLMHWGIRKLEAVVVALVATIGTAFFIEIVLAGPDWSGVASGFVPSLPDPGALFIALGILGATVMPHNLYLHSSLVQTRRVEDNPRALRKALKWNNIDSAVSLNLAFFVNAAILIMAAAVFYTAGYREIAEIQDAHRLLEPLLGTTIAPIAFAIALLASGQSSTITGTLAGQIVMEGYLNLRIRPWLRRLLTRLLAMVPALVAIWWHGERATGGLLVLSQVVLSLQLPFAIIPLVHFASDRKTMREFVVKRWVQVAGWVTVVLITGLNVKLVWDQVLSWRGEAGESAWLLDLAVLPLSLGLSLVLLYLVAQPLVQRYLTFRRQLVGVHAALPTELPTLGEAQPYRRIGIALDFSGGEEQLLEEAARVAAIGGSPEIFLLHILESPAARFLGLESGDSEAGEDRDRLQQYAAQLEKAGFTVHWALGAGNPARELARLANERDLDLIILGGHGHRGLKDLLYGTTTEALRHRARARILAIPLR